MSFTKPKNIETAFQHIRLFCGLIVLCAFVFSGYMAYESHRQVAAAYEKIYILASGKTLDPDERVIQANITKALYLADGSAKRLYDNLKESGYYANIISGNISQAITVDSIALDTRTYPFYFRCFATQKIIRTTSIVTRDLITEGWLRNTSRSDNNPHGFLIERWNTIDNKDLKVENR
jgi:hypothetical protein